MQTASDYANIITKQENFIKSYLCGSTAVFGIRSVYFFSENPALNYHIRIVGFHVRLEESIDMFSYMTTVKREESVCKDKTLLHQQR